MKPRWWRPFERWRWRVAVNAAARDRALIVAGFFVEIEPDAAARWAAEYEARARADRWARAQRVEQLRRARRGEPIHVVLHKNGDLTVMYFNGVAMLAS